MNPDPYFTPPFLSYPPFRYYPGSSHCPYCHPPCPYHGYSAYPHMHPQPYYVQHVTQNPINQPTDNLSSQPPSQPPT